MTSRTVAVWALVGVLSFGAAGCTFIFQKGRRSDIQKIEQLSAQLEELQRAQQVLQDRLSQEIKDKQVSLKMMEKGLVITFVADVLFDSGKAKLKTETYPILDKVARVLQENVPDLSIGIEGHTDNQPIHHSGWKDNWELSTARALSVLRYMVDDKSISPDRVSAIGYGEFRPVSTNATAAGRKLNRRVEIVILPKYTKVKEGARNEAPAVEEPSENLK